MAKQANFPIDMHHLSNILEKLILQSLSCNSPTDASKVILRNTGSGKEGGMEGLVSMSRIG